MGDVIGNGLQAVERGYFVYNAETGSLTKWFHVEHGYNETSTRMLSHCGSGSWGGGVEYQSSPSK